MFHSRSSWGLTGQHRDVMGWTKIWGYGGNHLLLSICMNSVVARSTKVLTGKRLSKGIQQYVQSVSEAQIVLINNSANMTNEKSCLDCITELLQSCALTLISWMLIVKWSSAKTPRGHKGTTERSARNCADSDVMCSELFLPLSTNLQVWWVSLEICD